MIFFDGLYSFVGVILSSASLYVNKLIREKDNRDFYYGKYIFEPLVISINSFVLILMCIISIFNSIQSLKNGGNPVDTSSAMIYSFISTIGCYTVYNLMKRKNKKGFSELIKSESVQWFMDFVLSFSVLLGFIAVVFLSKTKYAHFTVYIDPLMVLCASTVCIFTPAKRFFKNLKELKGLVIPDEIYKEVKTHVIEIKNEYNFSKATTKVMKIGRSIKIETTFINNGSLENISLEEMNEIKQYLADEIDTGKYVKDLEVIFEMGEDIYIEMTA